MRRLSFPVLFLASLVAAQPAQAQGASIDTLYYVVRDGIVMTMQGHEIAFDFADDGTFSGEAAGSAFSGTYRLDGAQLCSASSLSMAETCTSYPVGKRPGDVFQVVSPTLGTVSVEIRQPDR